MSADMIARISMLYRTEAEWLKLSEFVPKEGELILYAPDENYDYVRIKAGDGNTNLHDLRFVVEEGAAAVFNTRTFANVIDGGRI